MSIFCTGTGTERPAGVGQRVAVGPQRVHPDLRLPQPQPVVGDLVQRQVRARCPRGPVPLVVLILDPVLRLPLGGEGFDRADLAAGDRVGSQGGPRLPSAVGQLPDALVDPLAALRRIASRSAWFPSVLVS